jgi:hypothetical protein
MVIEAAVALASGVAAHSITLLAFGFDSVIELISAAILMWRLSVELKLGQKFSEDAERISSRIGGGLLFALAAYVVIVACWGLWTRQGGEFSTTGLAIAIGAIPIMYVLAKRKIWIAEDQKNQAAEKQAAIDDLAEEINWATQPLVNPNPHPLGAGVPREAINKWRSECESWFGKVSKKLADRRFFTRAQQLHFDVLTMVDQVVSIGNMEFGHPYNILHTKIDRLREIIEQVGRV